MVWFSHLLKNIPQFVVIHGVNSFSIVKKAKINVVLEFFCFFFVSANDDNLISGSSTFSKSKYIWKFSFHVLLKASLKDFDHYLASI